MELSKKIRLQPWSLTKSKQRPLHPSTNCNTSSLNWRVSSNEPLVLLKYLASQSQVSKWLLYSQCCLKWNSSHWLSLSDALTGILIWYQGQYLYPVRWYSITWTVIQENVSSSWPREYSSVVLSFCCAAAPSIFGTDVVLQTNCSGHCVLLNQAPRKLYYLTYTITHATVG